MNVLTGYVPNPEGTARIVAGLRHPIYGVANHYAMAEPEKDTLLYPAMLKVCPEWNRHTPQGIGDCVSWACATAVEAAAAADIVYQHEPERWVGQVCTETSYGFMRVEALGLSVNRGGDGAYGAAAADSVTKFGTLHRLKYKSYDFREYSAARAKEFGRNGVPDGLEPTARKHLIENISLVTDFAEAAKAIQRGAAILNTHSRNPVASGRDKDGFGIINGRVAHGMAYIGVRYGKRPGLLKVNSWGDSTAGPRWPDTMPDVVALCSWWEDADTVDRVLAGRDSFAFWNYLGDPKKPIDWEEIFAW